MSIKETENSFILTQAGYYYVSKGKPERKLTADNERVLGLEPIGPYDCPVEIGKASLRELTLEGAKDLILEITPDKPIRVVRQVAPESSGTILSS